MLRAEIIIHCNVSVSKNGWRKRLRKSLLFEATPIIIMTKFADRLTSHYVALYRWHELSWKQSRYGMVWSRHD
jgi:hypothetical protein